MKQAIILLFIGMMVYGFWGYDFSKKDQQVEETNETSQEQENAASSTVGSAEIDIQAIEDNYDYSNEPVTTSAPEPESN